jgi:branched-chain amino acid transport system permease protein
VNTSMQLAANAVVGASTIAVIAVGFALIYIVTRFFHFAHGAVFSAGAYLAYLFSVRLEFPLPASFAIGVLLASLLGCALDLAIYRPLRHRGGSPMVLLLASLGAYIVLQNLISLAFGDDTKTLRSGIVEEGISVWGARMTPTQLGIIATSGVLVAVVAVVLKWSRWGKAARAVAGDPALADACGIEADRVILWTFAVGSALAGAAGVLVSLDTDMTPTMGMNALMLGVVAMVVGGVGSLPGLALGAGLVAVGQQVGAWVFGTQWQDVTAFVVLLIFLLARPQGFMGRKVRKVTV